MLYDKRKFIKRNTKILFTGIKISFHSRLQICGKGYNTDD